MWADLDVLPKVFHTLVIVVVSRPSSSIDSHLSRIFKPVNWLLCQMLYFVDIRLANALALSTIVDIEAED